MVNVKLCFLMDCTASMEPWIHAARVQIKDIVHETESHYPDANVKVAFVGYRDIQDTERFVVFPFRSASALVQGIEFVHAKGGGDEAEDVAGGLVQALRLEWDDADVKLIVHIADAPAHGDWFHAPYVSDEYPEGDPSGLDPLVSMQFLSQQDFDYTFIKISSSTDTMIEHFHNSFSRLGRFKVVDLRPQVAGHYENDFRTYDLLSSNVILSISESITRHSTASQGSEEEPCNPK